MAPVRPWHTHIDGPRTPPTNTFGWWVEMYARDPYAFRNDTSLLTVRLRRGDFTKEHTQLLHGDAETHVVITFAADEVAAMDWSAPMVVEKVTVKSQEKRPGRIQRARKWYP